MSQVQIPTAEEMEEFGRQFSARLRPGHIVKITGHLGAGKTTLVRGIVAGLGGNAEEVHSPTFQIVNQYSVQNGSVIHCDFYRLPENSELEDFGGLEFFESDSIFLIEWPERIRLWEYITSSRLLEADLEHDAMGRILRLSSMTQIVD